MNTASQQHALARPWLRPSAAALVALTDDPTPVALLRDDPGLVLHVLRYARPTPEPDTFTLDALTLAQPGLCETAAALLEHDTDPQSLDPEARCRGRTVAVIASELAKKFGVCSPDAAWSAGLVAGYFAQAQPHARTLLARWRLPVWVTAVVGFLELPLDVAVSLGGHRGLLRVVRAALRIVGEIPVAHESDLELDSYAPFHLEPARKSPSPVVEPEPSYDLLPRLLRLAAKVRQRSAGQLVHELEQRVERLTTALVQSGNDFETKLRDAKLAALAEFAAGASHEINNPLAVISTNVQHLRSHEEEPERVEIYDAVLRQTKRIHELLYGTRQFARPPRTNPTLLSLSGFISGLTRDFGNDSTERGVTLDLAGLNGPTRMWADASHVRTVLGHLVRNAIDAAGRNGWVRVFHDGSGDCTRIVVEDSGPGPTHQTVPHLFDPFFSGRAAGRGRGLGLAIAWRLAQLNGGDVAYAPQSGRTRFVLSLPSSPPAEAGLRRSA